MQIVAVQLDIAWQDKAANHEKIRRLLAEREIAERSLIVLPEMFDTGFSMRIDETAQTERRESERFLAKLAQTTASAALAGVVAPVEDGKASNEAVAFAPDGRQLVRYRKMRPFSLSGEDSKYHSGHRHEIFEWGGASIAPFICYDLRFPELFRPAVADGAELIVVIASWPDARSEHWVRLLQARAIENLAYVVGVNRCGSDPTLNYDGRSVIFSPKGECLVEADANEQVLVADIDINEVRRWRAKFPALDDMRLG